MFRRRQLWPGQQSQLSYLDCHFIKFNQIDWKLYFFKTHSFKHMIKSFKINKQNGRFSLTPPIQCLDEFFFKNLSKSETNLRKRQIEKTSFQRCCHLGYQNIPWIIKYRILVDPLDPDGDNRENFYLVLQIMYEYYIVIILYRLYIIKLISILLVISRWTKIQILKRSAPTMKN